MVSQLVCLRAVHLHWSHSWFVYMLCIFNGLTAGLSTCCASSLVSQQVCVLMGQSIKLLSPVTPPTWSISSRPPYFSGISFLQNAKLPTSTVDSPCLSLQLTRSTLVTITRYITFTFKFQYFLLQILLPIEYLLIQYVFVHCRLWPVVDKTTPKLLHLSTIITLHPQRLPIDGYGLNSGSSPKVQINTTLLAIFFFKFCIFGVHSLLYTWHIFTPTSSSAFLFMPKRTPSYFSNVLTWMCDTCSCYYFFYPDLYSH